MQEMWSIDMNSFPMRIYLIKSIATQMKAAFNQLNDNTRICKLACNDAAGKASPNDKDS